MYRETPPALSLRMYNAGCLMPRSALCTPKHRHSVLGGFSMVIAVGAVEYGCQEGVRGRRKQPPAVYISRYLGDSCGLPG